jgi:hypothetical protein
MLPKQGYVRNRVRTDSRLMCHLGTSRTHGCVPFQGGFGFLNGAATGTLVDECMREVLGLYMPQHIGPRVMVELLTQAAARTTLRHHYVLLQVIRGLHKS